MMKPLNLTLIGVTVVGLALLCCDGRADDTLRGGLIGAGIGAIVGHNSSHIDTAVAVPAFAAVGALLGSTSDHDWHVSSGIGYSGGYDDWRHHPYDRYPGRHYTHYYPRHRLHYRHHRHDRVARSHKRVAKAAVKKPRPVLESANLHPGVKITHISVPMANGILLDIHILNVNGRFVGPDGDAFDEMPSADTLARKYIPKNLRVASEKKDVTPVASSDGNS